MTSIPEDFSRSKLKDRKWKGEDIQVNKDIARIPTTKNRRCTDVLCCIIFFAFNVGMLAASIYGYVNGNPGKLIAPIDGDGNICGYTPGFENYPSLYIDDIVDAAADPTNVFLNGVCVKQCPTTQDPYIVDCKATKKNPACTPNPGEGYGTTEVLDYCYPDYDSLPKAAKDNWENLKQQTQSTDYGTAMADLYEIRWVLAIAAGIAVVVTLIYIKFMDWCAFWLSWFSVFLVLASLIGAGVWTYIYRQDQIAKDPAFENESTATWLMFGAVMCWIVAGIYVLVMVCSINSLRVAIAVIETAADYFADTKRIIFVPLLYFIFGILIFAGWVVAMICVASIGEIAVDSVALQQKDIVWTEFTSWTIAYMVFGFLWLICFLIACNEFVVIVSAITWYYSDKTIPDDDGIPGDSDVRYGFWWSIRYHMGSLAFGSFLMALVWTIRAIFEYIGEKMIDASGNNGCTRCLISCIRCCLDCFDRFIRYINRNAYIYMALSGESFCSSALNSFILILKNSAKFAFVEGIADIFMFLAKVFISTSTTGLSLLIMRAMTKVSSPWLPLFVVFLLSYMIASVFIAVFDVSANTILQCYLLDKEIAACSGLPDPAHVPPTMAKFFQNPAIAGKMKSENNKNALRQPDEEKQNLLH